MSGGPRELLVAGALAVASAAVIRFLWKRISGSDEDKPESPKQADPAGQASDGSSPEEGIWIYFGSQTGTAEGFSKELEQEATEHGLTAHVMDMEEFEPEEFVKHKVVILVVATYGEGDPTDNAAEFYKWIQDDSLASDTLEGVKFTVMGLGSRQYVNFNACGKMADKHMARLGATCIYQRGEGDDNQNIEEDFEQWKGDGLWKALQEAMGVSDAADAKAQEEASGALETAEAVLAKLPLRAEVNSDMKALPIDALVQVGGSDVLGKWYFQASMAPVTRCDELRQVSDYAKGLTTKHMEFDIKHLPAFDWKTADNLEVLPSNPKETVDWFAKRLGVGSELESNVTFVRANGVDKVVKKPFPAPCPVRNALGLHCDLCATPTRAVARRLAALVRDPKDRDFLQSLLQDREAYQWLTGDGVHISFQEFFELFLPSAKVELGDFLQLCPRQKSRPYTISSSSREDPKHIGICVSMVQEKLTNMEQLLKDLAARGHEVPRAEAYLECLGREESQRPRCFKGLCSTLLCTNVAVNDKLWIYARPSSFRLPRKSSTPIVMIGAGTGLAPFRAFIREFRSENGVRKNTILFFGCTKENEDYIYREELKEALELDPPALGELITAFSREQAEKIYVQHRLKEQSERVAQLIGKGAYIYVCGAAKMGAAVREELTSALGSADQVNRLLTEGRLVEELW